MLKFRYIYILGTYGKYVVVLDHIATSPPAETHTNCVTSLLIEEEENIFLTNTEWVHFKYTIYIKYIN